LQTQHLFIFERCSQQAPFCLTIAASQNDFHQEYQLVLAGWKIIALLIATLCWQLGMNTMYRLRSIEGRVMKGLRQESFYCQYQPIVEIDSGKIIGCEVLARYQDTKGAIFPDTFIHVITAQEKTWPFTEQIINRLMEDLDGYDSVPHGFRININFFPEDIESGAILRLLQDKRFEHKKLRFVIELTENKKLSISTAKETLALMVASGFEIAIDDFGTGYSNLSQVRDIQCHSLKVDRSFIDEMGISNIRSTLIPHIVDIAEKLGATVVAEGIETDRQRQELKAIGVQYGQGYIFAKPMPMAKLVDLLNNKTLG
jgi:sensor c-di-GMP phosphodiesterase-like protein